MMYEIEKVYVPGQISVSAHPLKKLEERERKAKKKLCLFPDTDTHTKYNETVTTS